MATQPDVHSKVYALLTVREIDYLHGEISKAVRTINKARRMENAKPSIDPIPLGCKLRSITLEEQVLMGNASLRMDVITLAEERASVFSNLLDEHERAVRELRP